MSDFDKQGAYGKLLKNPKNSRALNFREIRNLRENKVLAKIKCFYSMTDLGLQSTNKGFRHHRGNGFGSSKICRLDNFLTGFLGPKMLCD